MADSRESEGIAIIDPVAFAKLEQVSSFEFAVDIDVSIIRGTSEDEEDVTEDEKKCVLQILQQHTGQLQGVFKDESFIHLEKVTEDCKIKFCVFSEVEFINFVEAVHDGRVEKRLTDFIQSFALSLFGDNRVCLYLNLLSKTQRTAKNYFRKLSTSSDTVEVSAGTEKETENIKAVTDESDYESFIIIPEEQQQDSVKEDDLFPKISVQPGQFDGKELNSISVCQAADADVPTGQPSDENPHSKQDVSSTSNKPCGEIPHSKDDKTSHTNEQMDEACEFSSFEIQAPEDTPSNMQSNQVSASTKNETENIKAVTDESNYESFIIIPEKQQQDSVKEDDLFPKIIVQPGQFDKKELRNISACQAAGADVPTGQPSDQNLNKQEDESSAIDKPSDANKHMVQPTPSNMQSNQVPSNTEKESRQAIAALQDQNEVFEDAESNLEPCAVIQEERQNTSVTSESMRKNLKVDRKFNEQLARAIREDFVFYINPHELMPLLYHVINPPNEDEIEAVQQQKGRHEAASRMLQILTYKENWFDFLLIALGSKHLSQDHVAKIFEKKRDEVLNKFSLDQCNEDEVFQDALEHHQQQQKMQFFVYIAPANDEKIESVNLIFKQNDAKILVKKLEKMTERYRENMWTFHGSLSIKDFLNIKYEYHYVVRKTVFTVNLKEAHKLKSTESRESKTYSLPDSLFVFNIVETSPNSLAEGCIGHVGIIFSKLLNETYPVYVKALKTLPLYKMTLPESANLLIQLNKELETNVNMCTSAYILLTYLIGILVQGRPLESSGIYIPSHRAKSMLQSFKEVKSGDLELEIQVRIENVSVQLCKCAYPEHGACVLKLMDSCYPALGCTFFSKQLEKSSRENFPVLDETVSTEENRSLFHSVCNKLSDFPNKGDSIKELFCDVCRYAPLQYSLFEIDALHDKVIFEIVWSKLQIKCNELAKQYDFVCLKYIWDILPTCSIHREKVCQLIAKSIILYVSKTNLVDVTQEHASALIAMAALFEKDDFSDLVNAVSHSKNKTVHDLFITFLSLDCCKLMPEKYGLYIKQWFEKAACFNNSHKRVHLHMDDLPYMYQCLDTLFKSEFVSSNATLISLLDKSAKESIERMKLDEIFIGAFDISTFESQQVEKLFKDHMQTVLSKCSSERTLLATLADLWHKQNANCRLHGEIIMIVLNFINLNNCDSFTSGFMKIMESWRFWINIFGVNGTYMKNIHDHPVVHSAICILTNVAERMITLKLQCSFVRTVQKSEDASVGNMKKVYESLWPIVNTKERTDTLEFLSCWETAKTLLNKTDDTFSMMHDVLQKLKANACETIPDLDNAINSLEMKEKTYLVGYVHVVDLQNMSFWGILEDITIVVPDIVKLTNSDIFWDICQDIIKNNLIPQNIQPELEVEQSISIMYGNNKIEDLETKHIITLTILQELKSSGTYLYKSMWQPYFDGVNKTVCNIEKTLKCSTNLLQEIEFAEAYLEKKLDDWIKIGLIMLHDCKTYEDKMGILKDVLLGFNIDISHDASFSEALNLFTEFDSSVFTLMKLYDAKVHMDDVLGHVKEEVFAVLKELTKNPSLVEFLLEIVNEDVRNLIDAVEEHSEHQIQASTVSSLIDVKSFIRTFCKVVKVFAKNLFKSICTTAEKIGCQKLIQMIKETSQNVNCLRSLFYNLANHVAVTKEIVNMLTTQDKTATVCYSMDADGTCLVNIKCKNNKTEYVYSKIDISDHRSRAFLLMNTKKETYNQNTRLQLTADSYQTFINYIDAALVISLFLERLHQTGHPNYVCSNCNLTLLVSKLKCKATEMEEELKTWRNILKTSYDKYLWLCYFHPQQLWKMKQYLQSAGEKEQFLELLQYTGFQSDCFQEACKLFCNGVINEKDFGLSLLGEVLERLLKNILLKPVSFPKNETGFSTCSKSNVVQRGKLCIALLEKTSSQVIPTLMAMYRDTTGAFPLPHQVLFCREDTSWEEINLLLLRCLGSEKRYSRNKDLELYCIAMVENLPNAIQYLLVDEIKKHQWQSSRLALVCRGQSRYPFLDYFSDYVCHIVQMTTVEMTKCYEMAFPNVITITSEVPGLGKTTYIEEIANKQQRKLKTIYINGDIDIKILLSQLSDKKLQQSDSLHISVELVNDPLDLDTLIFQIIILRTLSHLSNRVHLQTQHVLIEIANTVNNCLLDSLFTTMIFKRKHMKWENFSNYIVSTTAKSSVQVVCHFLEAMVTKTLTDKDIHFEGDGTVEPLSEERSRELLKNFFSFECDNSFTLVNIAINVLAEQLRRMSCSVFFQVTQLHSMLAYQGRNIKQDMLNALLGVSKEFAKRSVKSCRSDQKHAQCVIRTVGQISATSVVERVETGLIRWTESNHLVIAFNNQDQHTTSFVYRDLKDVPPEVQRLYLTQERKKLPDFSKLNQMELQQMLQVITRKNPETVSKDILEHLQHSYVLTPDNFLKMILISQRIDANIPVIMMGETGCGKTSVIMYLSQVCGTMMNVFNFHAGIDEKQIIETVCSIIGKASKNPNGSVWLFLDEINTSNHLGLITNIICHRTCYDHKLPENVVVIAACNPYKLRASNVFTSGLKDKAKMDAKSGLVYRVNPLPENMLDYVWDFGTLSKNDEMSYIQRMVTDVVSKPIIPVLVDLLVESHLLIREFENTHYCVSLRDVDRCRKLIPWFGEMLKKKSAYDEVERNSVILSLAHTYYYRLSRNEDRRKYRNDLLNVFKKHNVWLRCNILQVILHEQEDILNRMKLPEGTAKNSALKENIFVVLVCILKKIPVFLIGKPGCSKSLSLQLIKDNLRGKDSTDEFFKMLPELYFVSYQGSEMSTSDGIIKVFEKAKGYKKPTDNENVLPVIILDEVGLAENSCFNPLKVLHSLLEPEDPQVSVVGISNWALDAAKMNRVIHLSRPDLDVKELYETGLDISVATAAENRRVDNDILDIVAHTYHKYIHNAITILPNFHGLRDFYSLVKYVSREISLQKPGSTIEDKLQCVLRGIERNFGGQSALICSLNDIFRNKVEKTFNIVQNKAMKQSPVMELIEDNIKDKKARNLMLITEGDAPLGVIEMLLKKIDREFVTIFGSQFDGDIGDEYNYRILSKIILCMEQGIVLILKDLERIYGSLYDMLNQNYTTLANKSICRIALGPHNNALCQVHEDFRCIVVVDKNMLASSDPPFLNRFEKQTLRMSDVLNSEQRKTVDFLETWTADLSKIENMSFEQIDLIPVYSGELIPSLVYSCSKKRTNTQSEIVEQCKHELINVCTPEGIIRGKKTILSNNSKTEYDILLNYYFELPIHNGLGSFLESSLEKHESCVTGQNIIILTHTNIHKNVNKSIQSKCQIEHLATFKSEKELSARLEVFWFDRHKNILIVQSQPSVDGKYLLLLKATVERQRSEFLKTDTMSSCEKHVVIILHLERIVQERLYFINFLSGWKLTIIDNLDVREHSLVDMHDKSIIDLIKQKGSLQDTISTLMFWAFTCIGYSRNFRTLDDLSDLIKRIQETEPILNSIEKVIWRWLENNTKIHEKEMWQADVACDKTKLLTYSTFLDVIDDVIRGYIKHPLAAIVYKVEICNAWNRCSWYVDDHSCEKKLKVWVHHMTDEHVIDISNEPPPSGPECLYGPDTLLHLKHPFSKAFFLQIEENVRKQCWKDCLSIMNKNEMDFIPEKQLYSLFEKYLDPIKQSAHAMFDFPYANQQNDYFDDFCALLCSKSTIVLDTTQKVDMLKKILISLIPLSNEHFPMFVTKLHITHWLNESKLHAVQHLVDACMQVQCKEPNRYYDEFMRLIGSYKQEEDKFLELEDDITKQSVSEITDNIEEESCYEITTWSRIIQNVCMKLLESSVHLKDQHDCSTWQRNSSMVLTHADNVSVVPSVSHTLSLCNHFASMIVISSCISEKYLVSLGRQLTKKELDSKEMFDFILKLLMELKLEAGISPELLLQFYSCYVSCCFKVNPHTRVMEWVLDETLSKKLLTEGNYHLFGPALHLAIASNLSLDHGPKSLFDIIQNERSIQGITFFIKLDKALCQNEELSFSCLCVDIFQHFIVENEKNPDIFISCLNKYIASTRCLSQTVAVAYVKYHLQYFSHLESENKLIEQLLKKEQSLNEISGLELCFIECVVAGNGIITFKRLCKNNKFLEKKSQQLMSNTFDLNPLIMSSPDLAIPVSVSDAFKKLPNDETSLTKAFNDSVNDSCVAFALFSATIHRFFLSTSLQPLSDTEKSIATNICRVAKEANIPKDALKLLNCLCRCQDFNFSVLSNICEESVEREFQIASFLIHVMCCCLTNHQLRDQDLNPSLCCMCMLNIPDTAKCYLPAVTKTQDVSHGFFSLTEHSKEVQFSECSYSFKSACLNNCPDADICSLCSKKSEGDKMTKRNISLIKEDTPMYKGYIPCDPNNDIITTTRSLSPVAFRFIQLLIHACFAGSLALGLTTKQKLAEHLELPQDIDVGDYLKKHLFTHWEVLTQLTTCGHAHLGKLLHVLLNQMDFLLFKEPLSLQSLKCRQFFEDSICKSIDDITQRRFSVIQEITRKGLSVSSKDLPLNLDKILQEVNIIPEDKFPLFLKHTLPPSIQNMKSEFIINEMDKKHPFLALVLAKEKHLSLLECLLPIVHWHSFCFEKISYKKTRNECRRLPVMDFINQCDQKKHSKKLFDDFRDSWKKLKSNENLLRKYNKNLGKIPKITVNNMVEDCIIIDRNCAIYQFLVALKNVQNEFLEDALIISLTLKSPSLSFMKKTDQSAHLAVLPIEEVTDKDIVHLNMDISKKRLSETFLRFSQCCKEYGHGRVHIYDFYFIEKQFADYILVKKPCLEVTASFPIVVFFGDCVYRSVAQFEDIEAFVKQCEIEGNIKIKVLNLMGQCYSYLRNILEYLEIIFTLMKRTPLPKNESDHLIQHYITQWPGYFLQRFPEVEDMLRPIKLCYLTSLFEYVESLEADTAIRDLGEEFTTPLNDELESNLETLTERTNLNLLERLLAALKRFAYRNIEDCGVSPEDQLGPKILDNPALWPRDPQRLFPDEPKQLDIHPDLCVKHIKSTVQYLHQYIEKKRGRFELGDKSVKSKRRTRNWHKYTL